MTVSRHNTNQRALVGDGRLPEHVTPPRADYVSNLEIYWHGPRRRAGMYELSAQTRRILDQMRPVPEEETFDANRADVRGSILLTLANRRYARHGHLNAAARAAGCKGVESTLRRMVISGEVIAEGPMGNRMYRLPRENDR